jgi:MFS family permease
MGFVNAHFVAFATGLGVGSVAAASALSAVGVTSIIGALAFGFLADKRGGLSVLATAYLLRGAGYAVLLLADSLAVATLGLVAIGLSWTSVISLTGSASAEQFGLRRLGTVYGTMFTIMPVGASLGVWVAGWVFDTRGNYDLALWISLVLGMGSAALIGLPRYRQLAPELAPATLSPGLAAPRS